METKTQNWRSSGGFIFDPYRAERAAKGCRSLQRNAVASPKPFGFENRAIDPIFLVGIGLDESAWYPLIHVEESQGQPECIQLPR